jgi:glycosyltransferase involved in cell wall biosynthesis
LSGITYYTYSLCQALSARCEVSAILMRQLLPTRLYPGRDRVGADIASITLPPAVPHFDGVDWFWGLTLARALWFLARRRPQTLIFQWWTGTVLHTYLALALMARILRIRIVVEFHEVLDTGEDRMVWVSRYVRLIGPLLFRLASGYIVHSKYEQELIMTHFGLTDKPCAIIPHANYDHYRNGQRCRIAPEDCCNLLYFGLIRPYKGLEDLVRAFNTIPEDQIGRYWLTVVGETWEGCTLPTELIAQSPYRNRITFVNRYVSDEEVDAVFGGADVVVLPYHRSSQSGPLHVALHYGLPVVVTAVGGLVEAVEGYDGAVLTEPANPQALLAAIRQAAGLRGRCFDDPRSWPATADRYTYFLAYLADLRGSSGAEEQPVMGLQSELSPSSGQRAEGTEEQSQAA